MSLGYNITINKEVASPSQRCGSSAGPNNAYGCSDPNINSKPCTFALASTFAANNSAFLSAFALSYAKMSTVGYGLPANKDGQTATGKLGTLTSIDFATCASSNFFTFFFGGMEIMICVLSNSQDNGRFNRVKNSHLKIFGTIALK